VLFLKPLSLRERGWGEGSVLRDAPDGLEHRFRLLQNLIVPVTQDLEAQGFKVASACLVHVFAMLRTVKLDYQPG
jgi:hypothetical protein